MAQTFRKTEEGLLEVTTTQEGQDPVVVLFTRPELVSMLETKEIVQRPEAQAVLNSIDADIDTFELYIDKCDELDVH